MNPVIIKNQDTSYSVSDGAFYYYSGTLTKTDSSISLDLKEIFCDYCGELMKKNKDGKLVRDYRTKHYTCKLIDKGLIVDGYLYIKTNKKEDLISEHPDPFLKY